VQANIDPQHRDRIAFVRLASGRFQRGMKLKNIRTGRQMSVQAPVFFPGPRAQPRRGGLARRHHRHPQSREPAERGNSKVVSAAALNFSACVGETERAMLMGGACAKAYGWSPKKA
jgi:hypothetical protein